jgi:dolichol-phosphate mannosyltransferase
MDYSDLTVILPTFNESGTLGKLLDYITLHYRGSSIIVADDGSSDGTKEIVKKKAASYGRIRFLDRKAMHLRRGLTASIVDGIIASKTKFALVMDADLQHPPEKIAEIKRELDAGCDLAVASRADVTEWVLYRKIISKTLIGVGYLLLYLGRKETCDDIFSGYFGVDAKLFKRVASQNRRRFVMDGYKVLFDFLKCIRRGSIKIANVPYVFHSRKFGSSKAGMKQGMALFRSFFS